jgi:hypothetical protein
VTDYVFARQFLIDLAAFEQFASARDREILDKTLAAVIQNPELPGRMPSFYDPSSPSYLYRAEQFLIHFRVTDGILEFVNFFWPRV